MRRRAAAAAVFVIALGGPSWGTDARAQTAEELTSARRDFADGLKEEEQKHFASALEHYKRVQQVKDTVQVRYRIGSAYEGMGKPLQAIDAYQSAASMGATTPADNDVVAAARARVEALEPTVAHLTIVLADGSPPDTEVLVDDAPVAKSALSDVRLNAGPHVVTARAKDSKPFRAQLTISTGGRAEIPVALERTTRDAPPPPPPVTPPAPRHDGSSTKTIGIITAAVGGALLVGGTVALLVRRADISELERSCPGGNCPVDRQSELQSTHDRAVTLGPVGIVLGAAGIVALGAGIGLVIAAPSDGVGVALAGRFR